MTGSSVEPQHPPSAPPGGIRQRWNFPALGYALLPLLLAVRHVNAPPDDRTYGPSHWFLDYHHGFMRRALIGQLLSHVHFISWRNIFRIEAAVLACGIALTYLVFRSILFGNLDERRLGAFLLAAPAFLPHMAAMGGELDNVLYLIVLLACFLLLRYPGVLGLSAATLLTAVAFAIHEAFLLMFYPLLFVLILDLLQRRKITRLAVGLHCAAVALCFAFLLLHGQFHGDQAAWVAQAQQRTDMPIERAVFFPLHNTLRDQLSFVRQRYTHALVGRVFLTVALSIPYGFALWRLLLATVRRQRYGTARSRWMILCFFIPLCLVPLGHDIMRWLAALSIDMSLYILFLYQRNSREVERAQETASALRGWAAAPATAATFLYLLALGPWGIEGTHLFANVHSVLSGRPIR